jgi:hypothetical protein
VTCHLTRMPRVFGRHLIRANLIKEEEKMGGGVNNFHRNSRLLHCRGEARWLRDKARRKKKE